MLNKASGAVAATLLALAGAWVWPPASRAACLATPVAPGTNCATFTPDTASDVVNIYWLHNLALNRFFQLALFTASGAASRFGLRPLYRPLNSTFCGASIAPHAPSEPGARMPNGGLSFVPGPADPAKRTPYPSSLRLP
jgi:hypothetical protein